MCEARSSEQLSPCCGYSALARYLGFSSTFGERAKTLDVWKDLRCWYGSQAFHGHPFPQ